jgi:hypothetical protein
VKDEAYLQFHASEDFQWPDDSTLRRHDSCVMRLFERPLRQRFGRFVNKRPELADYALNVAFLKSEHF